MSQQCLTDKKCQPCQGGVPPLTASQCAPLLAQLNDGWAINPVGHLEKTFLTANFVSAMTLANRITQVAEAEGHHPDLHIAWGKCGVEIWTHKIQGLTESDFILAAKIDGV